LQESGREDGADSCGDGHGLDLSTDRGVPALQIVIDPGKSATKGSLTARNALLRSYPRILRSSQLHPHHLRSGGNANTLSFDSEMNKIGAKQGRLVIGTGGAMDSPRTQEDKLFLVGTNTCSLFSEIQRTPDNFGGINMPPCQCAMAVSSQ
jgi:hypothetical protein